MLYVVVLAMFRKPLELGNSKSEITLLAMPTDIDLNGHVNNGRYLTIFDLTRLDLFLRIGLFRHARAQRWMPLIAEQDVRYKKPLKMFQKFVVSLEITHWDQRYFYMVHRITSGGVVYVEARTKNVVLSKAGVLKPDDVWDSLSALRGASAS
jgi:acyl-CoA thioesterase FadM